MNWKEAWPLIKQGHQESKHSYIYLFNDLLKCYKQGYNWAEYFIYGFQFNDDEEYRQSFVSNKRHYPKITKLFGQSKEDTDYFNDKGLFNRNFSDLKGIETLDLRVDDMNSFKSFLNKHDEFFIKTPNGLGGHEVKKIKRSDYSKLSDEELYECFKNDGYFVLEEKIIQHPEVSKLSVNSVNTIRIITVKDIDGKITAPFMISRISINENYVDNASMGGASCVLYEDGVVKYDYFAYYPVLKYFDKNPITGFKFKGYKFPFFKESIDLCIKAASRCKGHFIGWDVAITEKGPVLIEGNIAPGFDFLQATEQLDEKRGKLKELEEAFKVKLQ